MPRLILTRDDEREIVLEEPRGGAVLRAALLLAAVGVVRLWLPSFWIAQAALFVLALWTLAGTLEIHRLRLDFGARRYSYRRGWRFARPLRQGTFDDVAGVVLDRHEPEAGLAASRLRSRLIRLEIPGCGDGLFTLGFPMGPRVAADKAADHARRLGAGLVDRTRLGADAESGAVGRDAVG